MIENERRGMIEKTAQKCGLIPEVAEVALTKENWQEHRVIERIFNESDYLEKLTRKQIAAPAKGDKCSICDEKCDSWTQIHHCGHFICEDCFGEYIRDRLGRG